MMENRCVKENKKVVNFEEIYLNSVNNKSSEKNLNFEQQFKQQIDTMHYMVEKLYNKSIKGEDENAVDNYTEELKKELEDSKNKIKEVEKEMRKLDKINKINTQFLITSTTTMLLSLICLIVFSVTGKYFINPIFYIIVFFMGLGWEVTAITSIISNRRK